MSTADLSLSSILESGNENSLGICGSRPQSPWAGFILAPSYVDHQPQKDPSGQEGGELFQRPEREEGERGWAECPLGPIAKATQAGGRSGSQENASLL